MKILILGATGRTGQWLVRDALKQGFKVHCLSRKTHRLESHENLTIFEGSPLSEEDLRIASTDCEAVLSVLNISRKSDFPWSSLRTPKTFLSDVMQKLITVMKQSGISRLIVCSAWGTSETRKDLPFWFKWTIDYSNITFAYKDHEKQEKLIQSSQLHWTIVRPVGLYNVPKIQAILESIHNKPAPHLMISRRALAAYMLDCVKHQARIKEAVVISKA